HDRDTKARRGGNAGAVCRAGGSSNWFIYCKLSRESHSGPAETKEINKGGCHKRAIFQCPRPRPLPKSVIGFSQAGLKRSRQVGHAQSSVPKRRQKDILF